MSTSRCWQTTATRLSSWGPTSSASWDSQSGTWWSARCPSLVLRTPVSRLLVLYLSVLQVQTLSKRSGSPTSSAMWGGGQNDPQQGGLQRPLPRPQWLSVCRFLWELGSINLNIEDFNLLNSTKLDHHLLPDKELRPVEWRGPEYREENELFFNELTWFLYYYI